GGGADSQYRWCRKGLGLRTLKPGGTILICNESNGDTDKDERWTQIIGGMTIYKDIELKACLEQAGFHEVQIRKKGKWLCVTARK
uniref:hypothetical protein n=1 Tax=Collinsella sp. TaxID=1965294 RepID=UPI003FEFBD82